jgi:hypothetical protein
VFPVARRAGQRGHIEEHRGKYRAIVSAGTDPLTGKRRFLKKTCDTEKQAKIELTKLLNQVDEQRHPRSKILVRQLVEKWFEVEDHEDSTLERYRGLNRKYIDPVFGSMQAAKLDAELLETFYARLRKCRHLCEGKRVGAGHSCRPLSNSSIRQIHFILRGSGDRGVRWGYLTQRQRRCTGRASASQENDAGPAVSGGGRCDPERGLEATGVGHIALARHGHGMPAR